jgi:hypothetical protein
VPDNKAERNATIVAPRIGLKTGRSGEITSSVARAIEAVLLAHRLRRELVTDLRYQRCVDEKGAYANRLPIRLARTRAVQPRPSNGGGMLRVRLGRPFSVHFYGLAATHIGDARSAPTKSATFENIK